MFLSRLSPLPVVNLSLPRQQPLAVSLKLTDKRQEGGLVVVEKTPGTPLCSPQSINSSDHPQTLATVCTSVRTQLEMSSSRFILLTLSL